MRRIFKITCGLVAVSLLASCVSMPNGPSNMALPGTGKNFNQFRVDDNACRQYATNQIGGISAKQASTESFAQTAALGTVIGATMGALAGGHSVGAGAATGLVLGSVVGAGSASASMQGTQEGYDNAYTQCMYASGHKVAVSASVAQSYRANTPAVAVAPRVTTVPRGYYPPPPPPRY